MNILELDSQNNVIAGSDLHSGQKWKKNAGTAKIAPDSIYQMTSDRAAIR